MTIGTMLCTVFLEQSDLIVMTVKVSVSVQSAQR